MSEEKIRKLLADYYCGTIGRTDEEILRSYFLNADYESLPEDLRSSFLLFAGFKSTRELRSSVVTAPRRKRIMPSVYGYALASVAAAFLIAGAIRLSAGTGYGYDYDGSTITDTDKALEEMKNLELLALLKDNEESLDKLFNDDMR